MSSLVLKILKYVVLGLSILYVICSVLFAPCEFVMIGFATDPMLKSLFPVITASFIYKDMVIIAIIVLVFLVEEEQKSISAYILSMAISTGLATIITPLGFVWMFKKIKDIALLQMYQTLSDIMSDPLFYDMILSTVLLLTTCALLLIKMFQAPDKEVKFERIVEFVPVKKYN